MLSNLFDILIFFFLIPLFYVVILPSCLWLSSMETITLMVTNKKGEVQTKYHTDSQFEI